MKWSCKVNDPCPIDRALLRKPYLDLTPEQIVAEQAVRTKWINDCDALLKAEQDERRAANEEFDAEMAPLRAALQAAEAVARARVRRRFDAADLELARATAVVDATYEQASPLRAREHALKPWFPA